MNGGTCSTPDFNMYECACPEGTSGTNCEIGKVLWCTKVDKKQLNNFKFCDIYKFIFVCIDEDECVSEPCFNGGTCIDSLNSYTCKCAQGFTGSLCKTGLFFYVNS